MSMPSGAWGFANPALVEAQTVIIEGNKGGLFVYNGTAGPGTLIYAVVPPGVTQDKYGNVVTSVMQAGSGTGPHLLIDGDGNLFIFNQADLNVIQLIAGDGSIRVYPPTGPGVQQLSAAISPVNGITGDGDQYAAGVASYVWISGVENAVRLFNGEFQFLSYAAGWNIDASFYSTATAIVNSLLPLSAEHPGSPGTQETWQPLGASGLVNWTIARARYRMTVEGLLRIQVAGNASPTVAPASQASSFANSLPADYQPAVAEVLTLGYNTNVVGADRWPRVVVTTTGPVNIALPALPVNTQIGGTWDIELS